MSFFKRGYRHVLAIFYHYKLNYSQKAALSDEFARCSIKFVAKGHFSSNLSVFEGYRGG